MGKREPSGLCSQGKPIYKPEECVSRLLLIYASTYSVEESFWAPSVVPGHGFRGANHHGKVTPGVPSGPSDTATSVPTACQEPVSTKKAAWVLGSPPWGLQYRLANNAPEHRSPLSLTVEGERAPVR